MADGLNNFIFLNVASREVCLTKHTNTDYKSAAAAVFMHYLCLLSLSVRTLHSDSVEHVQSVTLVLKYMP